MRTADLDAIFKSDLPCSERMVLTVIAGHSNQAGAQVWPSLKTIAAKAGVHEATAVRCVASLKRLGWLKAKRRFGQSTVYVIEHPASTSTTPVLAQSVDSTCMVRTSVLAPCASNHPLKSSNESSNDLSDDQTTPPATMSDAAFAEIYFDKFWEFYDHKKGRALCLKLWRKIPAATKGLILDRVPAYVRSTPDPKYRKHPATYLRGQHWEDEVPDADEVEPPEGTPEYWNYHAARMVTK